MAHLIDGKVNPAGHEGGATADRHGRFRRIKRDIHGESWKNVMRVVGAEASRTHSYDTSNSTVRTKAKFIYKCVEHGAEMHLGAKRHKKHQSGITYHLSGHKGCTFALQSANAPTAPVPDDVRTNAPTGYSKLDKCRSIYSLEWTRQEALAEFQAGDIGCTPAGAATYYAKLKKEFEEQS